MLDERKDAILLAIVREYIATGQPVGSALIAREPGVHVSSATVRNEMAVLEQEGYLQQPHTSAGRVPTDKAYRVFVDHLTTPGTLDAVRAQQVREFFATTHGALERMLHDTTRLLSTMTDYAAVVMGPPAEVATVVVGGLCIGVLGALINSVLTTFQSSAFTLAYRQLVEKEPPVPAY